MVGIERERERRESEPGKVVVIRTISLRTAAS